MGAGTPAFGDDPGSDLSSTYHASSGDVDDLFSRHLTDHRVGFFDGLIVKME